MTCLGASCFRLGLEVEVPGCARKPPLSVLLVRANLGRAGNLAETPREIFTWFSCPRSSTQLQDLRGAIWPPSRLIGAEPRTLPCPAVPRQAAQPGGLGRWGLGTRAGGGRHCFHRATADLESEQASGFTQRQPAGWCTVGSTP